MIVYKQWMKKNDKGHRARFEGWYLFGFLPLYIRQATFYNQ